MSTIEEPRKCCIEMIAQRDLKQVEFLKTTTLTKESG